MTQKHSIEFIQVNYELNWNNHFIWANFAANYVLPLEGCLSISPVYTSSFMEGN